MSAKSSKPQKALSRRKDARPAEIIEAALKEFAENGFAATKLEDVAKRAGASKATIYVYFADKQALFEACMRSRMAPVLGDALGLVDAFPGNTEDLLRLLLTTMHHRMYDSEARALLRIIIAECGKFPFLAEMHHRETVSKGKALLARIVKRGIERGELRDGDYARLPMIIAAPQIVATIWSFTFQHLDPLDRETFLAAHIDLVLNGILHKKT